MAEKAPAETEFEIGHVLFIDLVGYSKRLINEQKELLNKLNSIVRETEVVRTAEAAGKLIRIPTGDGMALVFRTSPEAPARGALEITKALREEPELQLRMGIHSGPVSEVRDVNERANIAGAGINIAQRVMDCGDAGHILLSKHVAEDLEHYPRWRPHLHDLGECEVKHGVRVHVVNLYTDELGNPEMPDKFKQATGASKAVAAIPKPIERPTARRWAMVGVLLLMIAALVSGVFVFLAKRAPTGGITSTATPEKSIAVLPFENLSRDPDNAYFAEGIQDEILARLAKIADLKVISRTSTQKYKSAPDNLREIAKQLAVANILEGSVQKAADQVRVTVQLINATTDAHLWAETYDRKLSDVFAVESEIAKTIADTLQAKLSRSAEHVLASHPTENPEAHELYLKGRYFWNRRTGENLKKAAEYFQQAIGKDPKYALAYSGLADCHVLLPLYTDVASNPRDELPQAFDAARKAVELDDTLAEAHASLARALASNLQLSAATSEFNRAVELNPNYATAHQWFGECLQSQGRVEEGLAELKRAQELDPLSLIINSLLGFAFDAVGKSDEGIAQLRKTIEIEPTFQIAHSYLGNVLEHRGQLTEAIVEYEKSTALRAEPISLAQLARAYFLVGRKPEAQQLWDKLKSLSERQYVPAYSMAVVQLTFGNQDEAIRLLEKSYEDHAPFDSADLGWILVDHRLDSLRSDPRFKNLITRIFSGEPR